VAGLINSPTAEDLAVRITQADPMRSHPQALPSEPATRAAHTLSWRVDGDPQPLRAARRLTTDALTAWGMGEVIDAAALVASELVDNAARHGAPPITLALSPTLGGPGRPPGLLVEVTDASASVPKEREPGEEGGFGLILVQGCGELSVGLHPSGKAVRVLIPLEEVSRPE
jgi:anti-sigma regulatory factor (Ser/Thr protein kinase)